MSEIQWFEEIPKGIRYRNDGETLEIIAWGRDGIRVRSVMQGEVLDTSYALFDIDPSETSNLNKIEINGEHASLTNGKICALLTLDGWTHQCYIHFVNQDGKSLLKDIDRGGALGRKARNLKGRLGGDFTLTASFESDIDEKIYGMGQYQQEFLNLKGCSLELAHRNSQASVPFYISDRGYGFLWNNPSVGEVHFALNQTVWKAVSTKQLDYWITAGDTPDELEQHYSEVTGRVPMMPEYGLGFWQCKLRYWNQEQLLKVAREYHKRNVPVSVIVVDFFHWPKMGDFRFEEEFFPDPKAMVEELKSYGMELMVSVWPQIDENSENFEEMRREGLLIRTEQGIQLSMRFGGNSQFFDATNQRARDYVWEKCRKNYYNYGIKVFWLDEAEPEFTVTDYENYRCYMGPYSQIGNLYPQLYSRTFYDGQRNEGQENVVNLVRCAWAGSQRYGALVWSGDIHSDWETFRRQLCAGLNMGMAGIPWWTTDIGGFSGGKPENEAFRELLIRWFEWGTFCPVMRLHGDRECNDRHVYHKDGSEALFTGGDNEIWSYGEENTSIFEKYIKIREQMRSYTRRLMEEAHTYGRPVMRPMFYEFPKDKNCWDIKDQYMFGESLLVAPVMYPKATSRKVYLPQGETWQNVWNQTSYEGGQEITVETPLDVIPVFTRDESVSFSI